MKSNLLKLTKALLLGGFMLAGASSAWADITNHGPQTLNVKFDGTTDPTIRIGDGTGTTSSQCVAEIKSGTSTHSDIGNVEGGHLSVTTQLQYKSSTEHYTNRWRGDLVLAQTYTLTKEKDAIIAIKFIGDKTTTGTFKCSSNTLFSSDAALVSAGTTWKGNHIYYVTIDKYADATGSTLSPGLINFKVADESKQESYTVDWIATFESVEALNEYINWQDDGYMDTDDAFVKAQTATGSDTKDLTVRYTNTNNTNAFDGTDYTTTALLHINSFNRTSTNTNKVNNFASLLSFDMTAINAAMTAYKAKGYVVSDARITLTNHCGYKHTYKLYNFTQDFSEATSDNKYTYKQISNLSDATSIGGDNDNIKSAITDDNLLASATMVNTYGQYLYALPANTTAAAIKKIDISNFQQDFTSSSLINKIDNNTANTLSVLVISESATETTFFSKDISSDNYPTSTTSITKYEWNDTNSKWEENGTTTDRFAQILSFLGMTESELATAAAPKLTVVLSNNQGYTLTVTDAGAATLVLPYKATIPTGAEVYTLNTVEGGYAKATAVTETLNANTPVYVKAAAGDYTFEPTSDATYNEASDPTSGALIGVYKTKTFTYSESTPYYILATNGIDDDSNPVSGVGFYKANNTTVNPFRAYLHTGSDAQGGNAKAFIGINFGGAAINDVDANVNANKAAQGKFIQNGRMVIVKNGNTYNAAGQQIK